MSDTQPNPGINSDASRTDPRDAEVRSLREQLAAERQRNQLAERTAAAEQRAQDLALSEEALRQSEEKFRRIADHIQDVLYSVDIRTREFRYLSPVFERVFGYTQEDIRNMGGRAAFLSRVIEKAGFDEQRNRFSRLESQPTEGVWIVDEEWWRCKDGTLKCVEDRWTPVYESGRLVTTEGVLRDITERKRSEEALRQSREQLQALAARLHNIREEERTRISREIHDQLGHSLTALNLNFAWLDSKLAKAGVSTRSGIRRKVRAMSEQVKEEMRMVRQIAAELRPALLDVIGLEAAIEWLATEFQKQTRIPCELEMPAEPLGLDENRTTAMFRILQQALNNVVQHAQASRVRIRLAAETGRVVLQVRDDGRGITEAERNSFTSLGLLGMRERARACGGDMTVEAGPARGTTVTATMPLR